MENNNQKLSPSELPFLVTHWLTNFRPSATGSDQEDQHEDAIRRIHDAASQISLAFSDLGVFGMANKPVVNQTRGNAPESHHKKRASYNDMKRQWSHVPPNHLEIVAESSASIAAAASSSSLHPLHHRSSNLFQVAQECRHMDGGGRRLGEITDLTSDSTGDSNDATVRSILHTIPLFGAKKDVSEQKECKVVQYSGPTSEENYQGKMMNLAVVSELETCAKSTGEAMRSLLSIREEFRMEADEIAAIQVSIRRQQEAKVRLQNEKTAFNNKQTTATSSEQSSLEALARSDFFYQEIQNCDRIIAQLSIKLNQLVVSHGRRQQLLLKAEREAHDVYTESKILAMRYRDPFQLKKSLSLCGTLLQSYGRSCNQLTSFLMARQIGSDQVCNPRRIGLPISIANAKQARKAVICTRLCHSVTINAHLTYPIYCLQFDKSGQYFVTGADDCLVKLFSIGAAQSKKTVVGTRTFTYGANGPGAVLVCSLRGHAGVICDIDVSSDNAFLATASDDGDVRIWGMKDGCPIAILRGHEGGANMVSWSKLSPYRLVSSGMDGLARIWDIRDAALKRYGAYVGTRMEYTLPLYESEKRLLSDGLETHRSTDVENGGTQRIMLPPLPPREGETNVSAADPAANVAIPQAPGDTSNVDETRIEAPDENINNPGTFVANDILDEGVWIVAKLQHGEMIQETGPGTRSRSKRVKVICVARCPRGESFATGSDDGLCRVWEDQDDERLALIDSRGEACLNRAPARRRHVSINTAEASTSKLLIALVGHMSSITDLHYSNAGDRLLTASQKDGNARIWSFCDSTSSRQASSNGELRNRYLYPKQIVLRLRNIDMGVHGNAPARTSRRRGGNSACSSTSSVTCDVAVWTSDDSKIVTSQSCPSKGNRQDIVPGSQILLIWDSWSGNCLLAIKQAHSQQCPVVITHPFEPSIICSAGLDGVAKVWDLESGRCLLRHKNDVNSGPAGPSNERGKEGGYLDGTFDPLGHYLLLTDDSGRITMFDCLHGPSERGQRDPLDWMTEQYFANDYYELFFNTNGYCVERGSEQPPHLAPRAARCNHAGSAWSDDVCETFRSLKGPSPLDEDSSASARKLLRLQARGYHAGAPENRRTVVMMDFDPARTVQVNGSSELVVAPQAISVSSRESQVSENDVAVSREPENTGRSLSSNFRWRDYEDLIREEGLNDAGDPDVGDEEFVPRGVAEDDDDDLSDGLLSDSEFRMEVDNRSNRRSTRTGIRNNARSQRANRRENERARVEYRDFNSAHSTRSSSRRVTRTSEEESDEENGLIEEVLSTNNSPSGPYVNDYNVDGHLFKLANLNARVNRAWLLRTESSSSYKGRKVYAPQVGDSVVYIPRAHADTIREFPTLKAPWKDWPSGTSWPIVRCRVVHVRYRFPFKDYFRRTGETKCVSVVAILTLEVTGIPELSADREFPWPKPTFIDRQVRSTVQMFEVSIFESGQAEYIIPEQLFLWRLKCLESVLRSRSNEPFGLRVVATYSPDGDGEDPVVVEYDVEIIRYGHCDEGGDEQLNKSGFDSLIVSWNEGGEQLALENLSPWEVTIPEHAFDAPIPRPLALGEKRAVARALRSLESNEAFKAFIGPVDTRRYTDYLARVEVPMDTGMIKERLGQDFYVSLLHVLSDIKLIRENCLKYNGQDEIGQLAMHLFSSFKDLLKLELANLGVGIGTIAELDDYNDFIIRPDDATATSSDHNGPRTRSHGASTIVSSLELLPPPTDEIPSRSTRSAARTLSSLEPPEDLQRRSVVARSERLPDSAGLAEIGSEERNMQRQSSRTTRRSVREAREGAGQCSIRTSTREVANITISSRSTRSPRGLQNVDGRRSEMQNRHTSVVSRPSRSAKQNVRHDHDEDEEKEDDDDEYEEDSKDGNEESEDYPDDEEEECEEVDDADDEEDNSFNAKRVGRSGRTRTSLRRASVLEATLGSASPRRHPLRKRLSANYADEESDIEMREEAEDIAAKKLGRSPRKRFSRGETGKSPPTRRQRLKVSLTAKDDDSESEEFPHGPVMLRLGAANSRKVPSQPNAKSTPLLKSRRTRSSTENNSDSDESDVNVGEDVLRTNTRQRAEGGRRVLQSATRTSPAAATPSSPTRRSRSARPVATSYHEVDSDEEDEFDCEEIPPQRDSRSRSRTTLKRSSDTADDDINATDKPTRKRHRETAPQSELPKLNPWPNVPMKKISAVAKGILEEMRVLDADQGLFAIPVVEQLPSLEELYLSAVSTPMDFRTIEEERIPTYESISELQDDLILVFRNCVTFNDSDTEIARFAIMLLEQLGDVFLRVCRKERVKVPTGWKQR